MPVQLDRLGGRTDPMGPTPTGDRRAPRPDRREPVPVRVPTAAPERAAPRQVGRDLWAGLVLRFRVLAHAPVAVADPAVRSAARRDARADVGGCVRSCSRSTFPLTRPVTPRCLTGLW